jgi:uncharacterized RDD family membrane protein YckC
MDWYYVDGGKQAGPVGDNEIEQLAAIGKIQRNTLVWREGMANWLPYEQVKPTAFPAPLVASPTAASGPAGPSESALPPIATAPSGPEVVCAQCNRIFPKEDTIRYGDSYVCATCKPAFVQKVKEGVSLGSMNYAGFWIRFLAKVIDGLVFMVLAIPYFIYMFGVVIKTAPGQPPNFAQMGAQIFGQVAMMVISVGYSTFFQGKWGATLGKMACGLRVVTADGGNITYARAFGRAMAEILSGMICYIGYIIAAFDSQKRSLHDHIANTRVIRTR